ncbi:centrosome microtubule-binding domain of Cep57-domain-containing protein [Phyllosticta citrichinensis]
MSGAIPGLEKRPEHTGDTTELSFMARDEVARLRKALEEERAAARRQSRAPSKTRQGQDETVRSQSLPRKSSMKDLTTASRPMDLTESITGRIVSTALEDNRSAPASPTKQDTQRSILSNSGRRRPRSAPNDVTSAFILPDITMDIRNIPQPAPHDKGNCTVCHKSACAEHQTSAATDPSPPIPTTVPVSERVSADDIDATLRPTQPAPLALATVIKELQDELTHLNLQKAALDAVLRTHDASMAKRKRKAVEAKIAKLLHAISVKSDQIYALYDVVESQPYEQQQGPHQADDGDNEREVEETLLSVGIDPDEMRQRTRAKARSGADGLRSNKAKRVVIESVGGRSEDGAAAAAADDVSALLDDESELPWEGISETDLAA